MTDNTLSVVLVVASTRPGRVADALLPWLRPRLRAESWFDLDVVDLADHPVETWQAGTSPITETLDRADAFVVLVPEYNHSFPGSLKSAIDAHRDEWARKPVTFVAYGAGSGGIRAVEQLRQVFPEVQATTTRNVVTITAPWDHLDSTGRFVAPAEVEGAVESTLAELRWWARALAVARHAEVVPA